MIRELCAGSHRFNEIRRGVPKMSPSLLAQRLRELEASGVVVRRRAADGEHAEYYLTPAGEELAPIIIQMGVWGRRWAQSEISRRHLDAGLLMWDVRRRVHVERLPARLLVVEFHFTDGPKDQRDFWLVHEGGEIDLCLTDPGHRVDLWVETDVLTLTRVWLGDERLEQALRDGRIRLTGPTQLRRAFPGWLRLGALAGVKRISEGDDRRGAESAPAAGALSGEGFLLGETTQIPAGENTQIPAAHLTVPC